MYTKQPKGKQNSGRTLSLGLGQGPGILQPAEAVIIKLPKYSSIIVAIALQRVVKSGKLLDNVTANETI